MGKVLLILDGIFDENGLSLFLSYKERRFSDKLLRRKTVPFRAKKTFLVLRRSPKPISGGDLYGRGTSTRN